MKGHKINEARIKEIDVVVLDAIKRSEFISKQLYWETITDGVIEYCGG